MTSHDHAANPAHGHAAAGRVSTHGGHADGGYPFDGAHDDGHGHGVGKYVAVFLCLCFLTGMSFFTYSDLWPFHETPSVAWVFMMAVSCTKALLVVLFFMHVKYEANWKYVLTIPASIMALFLLLALVPDIGMRVEGAYGYRYTEERRRHVGVSDDAERIEQASQKLHGGAHGAESTGH